MLKKKACLLGFLSLFFFVMLICPTQLVNSKITRKTGETNELSGISAVYQHTKEEREPNVSQTIEEPFNSRADLAITDLKLQPEIGTVGKTCKILIGIDNRGEDDSGKFKLSLKANRHIVYSAFNKSLKPGQHKKVAFSWIPKESGLVNLFVSIHTSGSPERMIKNNTCLKSLVVRGQDLLQAKVKVVSTKITPGNPKPGEKAAIKIGIKNVGTVKIKNFPIKVDLGKNDLRWFRLKGLNPGKTKKLEIHWRVKTGNNRIKIYTRPGSEDSTTTVTEKRPVNGRDHMEQDDREVVAVELSRPTREEIVDLSLSNLSIQFIRDWEESHRKIYLYSVTFRVTNISAIDIQGKFVSEIKTEGTESGAPGLISRIFTRDLSAGETAYYQYNIQSPHSALKVTVQTDAGDSFEEFSETNNIAEGTCNSREVELDKWHSFGPTKIVGRTEFFYKEAVGKLSTLCFDAEDKNIMYASSARCGIWKSMDGGKVWTPQTDCLPNLGFVGFQADPFRKGVLYAVGQASGGLKGVFKSEDYGRSWKVISTDLDGDDGYIRLYANKKRADEYWATNKSGLWKSIDGCKTWDPMFSDDGRYPQDTCGTPLHCAFDENDYQTIYLVAQPPSGSTQATIARSVTGGAEWTFVTRNLLKVHYSGRICVHQANPSILYAAFKDKSSYPYTIHVYKSPDAGVTWREVNQYQAEYSRANKECVDAITTDPDNPDILFIGGVDLYRSTDGGLTVKSLEQVHVDQHQIVFHPENHDIMFVVNDGGVYKSTDRGITWEPWNHELPNVEFYDITYCHISKEAVAGGTQDNGTIISYYGNKTWTEIQGGDGSTTVFNPLDEGEVYATFCDVYEMNKIKITTYSSIGRPNDSRPQRYWGVRDVESSAASTGLTDGGSIPGSITVNPKNPRELAVCIDDLFLTKNKGQTWPKVLSLQNGDTVYKTVFDQQGNLYAVSYGGNVYIYTDENRGSLREISSTDVPDDSSFPMDISVCPEGKVYVCYKSGKKVWLIQPSTGGNYTSLDISGDLLPEVKPTAIQPSPFSDHSVYLGTYNGVYKGTQQSDGTWKWEDYNFGLPLAPVGDLDISEKYGTMVVGTTGRGVFKVKIKHSGRSVR